MSSRFGVLLLWFVVTGLLALGLTMVTSTSVWSMDKEGATYGLLTKQIYFGIAGVIVAIILSFLDYRKLRPYLLFIFIATVLVLALCFVPGIGKELNGERRWIGVGGLSFQPSECAKITIILCLSAWFARYKRECRTFWKGFIFPGIICALPLGLIFFEKDMGTAVALGATCGIIFYLGGTRLRYLIFSGLLALAGLGYAVFSDPNRTARMLSFQDLEATKERFGAQQWRALLAMSNGGIEGVGLGNSTEKHGYLPYAHTDFIFAPIGEELGLYGTLGVLVAYFLVVFSGMLIASQVKDTFGRLIVFGLVFAIFSPAMLNIAVVTSCLPNSGLPLPFISCGGTNLFFALLSVGIITSVQRWSHSGDDHLTTIFKTKKASALDYNSMRL